MKVGFKGMGHGHGQITTLHDLTNTGRHPAQGPAPRVQFHHRCAIHKGDRRHAAQGGYAWYESEMGYACRMVDLACHMESVGI